MPSCASSEMIADAITATAYTPLPSGPRLLARIMLVAPEKPNARMRVASVREAELTRPRLAGRSVTSCNGATESSPHPRQPRRRAALPTDAVGGAADRVRAGPHHPDPAARVHGQVHGPAAGPLGHGAGRRGARLSLV